MDYEKKKTRKAVAWVITSVLVVIIAFGISFAYNTTETTYIITVTDKERVTQRSGDRYSSKYLVFGKDENGNSLVFQNTDTFWKWKWDSSNIQGELDLGNKYQITVVGFRVPFFSMYENIVEVVPVE